MSCIDLAFTSLPGNCKRIDHLHIIHKSLIQMCRKEKLLECYSCVIVISDVFNICAFNYMKYCIMIIDSWWEQHMTC